MEWYYIPSLLLTLPVMTVNAVPLIKAPWGALQGISVEGDGGRMMNAYLGIPFAVPPLGELRFEKPLPHPGPGEGKVFMADKTMPACKQTPLLLGASRETSEDCLMLDVYAPANGDTDKPYAVMVFIHGGGFTVGDARSYRPSKLVVDGRVIVVVIQYRLGVHGFLSTGDGVIPGNVGLWDQNLAIRWVKDNIQSFGGDPSRITIFGESAGSGSVGMQMMSTQSKGLFQRGIMQSGGANMLRYAQTLDYKAVFKGLADFFECQGESTADLVTCLKEQGEEEFFNKSLEYSALSPAGSYFFPIVDGEFIPQDVNKLLQDADYMKENQINDIDIMIGFNNKEGALALFMTIYMNVSMEDMYTSAIFQNLMDMSLPIWGLNKNAVVRKTVEFFYRGAEAKAEVSETLGPLVDMYGDTILTADIVDWAHRLAASSHSAARYLYVFDHDFAFNEAGPIPGSHHGDELILEFDNTVEQPEDFIFKKANKTGMAPEEEPLSDKLIQIFTSFAKTGNPNPPLMEDLGGEWPQFTVENEAYLSISKSPRVVQKLGQYRDRAALWNDFLPELSKLTADLPLVEPAQTQPTTEEQPTAMDEPAKEEL